MDDDALKVRRRMARRRWEANRQPVSGVWETRRRVAAAMRTVIERLTISDAPEAELGIAAERLEEYAAHLGKHPQRRRYVGFSESALSPSEEDPETPAEDEGGGHFDYSPLIGRSNPLSPPIDLWSDDDDRVHGRVVFGSAYEGPPGCVHGGYIAAAFDEVLGYAQTFSGQPGMTANLSVDYRTPTPLHAELRFEASITSTNGRKITCHGTLHAGERLCAEASGLFISMRPGIFDRLVKERAERDAGG